MMSQVADHCGTSYEFLPRARHQVTSWRCVLGSVQRRNNQAGVLLRIYGVHNSKQCHHAITTLGMRNRKFRVYWQVMAAKR